MKTFFVLSGMFGLVSAIPFSMDNGRFDIGEFTVRVALGLMFVMCGLENRQ